MDLDVGIAALEAFLVATQRLAIHRDLVRPGLDHALARVIVIAGAQIAVAGGRLMAARGRVIAAALDALGERAPFLPPRLRLIEPRVQALHHLVDLAECDGAPRRHALGDQRRIRPLEVVREAVDPVARIEITVGRDGRRLVHGGELALAVPQTVYRPSSPRSSPVRRARPGVQRRQGRATRRRALLGQQLPPQPDRARALPHPRQARRDGPRAGPDADRSAAAPRARCSAKPDRAKRAALAGQRPPTGAGGGAGAAGSGGASGATMMLLSVSAPRCSTVRAVPSAASAIAAYPSAVGWTAPP